MSSPTAADPGATPNERGEVEILLYEKWQKIYPLWVKGPFQTGRRFVLAVLLGVFYLGPWITWDGRPAILFDLAERKFHIFSATFWPQEFVLVSWLLMIGAFSLFAFTVMAGRVWCGWACPQTIWTLCYQWIEKLVEGDRNQRLRLDRGPWNARRVGKKSLKYVLWCLLALSIGITFVGFFEPIRELLPKVAAFDLHGWEAFWVFFPAVGSLLLSGILREQVCFHMCPYARFQSVMFDKDTLIIAYDEERGEPRGSRKRSTDPAAAGLGSCIDCKLCVAACPTGIDIRDGLQYQCIGCAQCVDACDGVMDQMGYPKGLVRYSSQHRDHHETRRILRPRLVGYAVMLVALVSSFGWALSHRVPLGLDIIRDRNRLYREYWDGSIENVYTLKLMNREERPRRYRIDASGELPLELKTPSGSPVVEVGAGELLSLPVQLVAREFAGVGENSAVAFRVEAIGDRVYTIVEESRFVRPVEE
jgi:cytochrome c oxidase accessory protein FixG